MSSDSCPQLPEEFLARLQIIFQQDAETILRTFCHDYPLTLRYNSARHDKQSASNCLADAGLQWRSIATFPQALIIEPAQRQAALNLSAYQDGFFYAQSLASQLAVLALAPQADEEILDMCAAPGGKTTYISNVMNNSGRIAAVEKSKSRFHKLLNTIRWQKTENVECYHKDAISVWRRVPERFDRVLLDAPCSSESRFDARDQKTYAHWSLKKIKAMAKKQKALAYSAVKCLKPGGRLTYCTCTFAPEENEAVINWLLEKFKGQLEIEPLALQLSNSRDGLTQWQQKTFHNSLRLSQRLLPDDLMRGFFICNLRKQTS